MKSSETNKNAIHEKYEVRVMNQFLNKQVRWLDVDFVLTRFDDFEKSYQLALITEHNDIIDLPYSKVTAFEQANLSAINALPFTPILNDPDTTEKSAPDFLPITMDDVEHALADQLRSGREHRRKLADEIMEQLMYKKNSDSRFDKEYLSLLMEAAKTKTMSDTVDVKTIIVAGMLVGKKSLAPPKDDEGRGKSTDNKKPGS